MFKNLKIGTKLIGSFLVLMSVSLIATSYIEFRMASNAMETQMLDDLTLVADGMEGYVLEFLEGTKKRAVDFSSDGFIRDSVSKIISGEDVSGDLSRHLINNKKSLDPSILGIIVVGRDGIVVSSTDEDEIGLDYSDDVYFLQSKTLNYNEAYLGEVHVGHTGFAGRNAHLVAASPLVDIKTGELLGVLINHIKLEELSSILLGERQIQLGAISSRDGRRETLEIYLVNKEKIMITESRFLKDAPLKQKVDTIPVGKCETMEEMSGIYQDYRGVSVVGASMCFRNGWTLLAEIDEAEAFASLVDLRNNAIYLTVILLFVSALYAVFLSRGIVSPIKTLSRGVKMISGGDLSHRVKVESKDEIGQLASSFNQMTEQLQEYVKNLKNTKDEIEEEKIKLEILLGGIGDAVFAVDNGQNIILFNKQAEELSGYKSSEVLGKPYYEFLKFVKAKDKSENIEFIRKALSGKKADMADHTFLIRKDKRNLPVADSASPIKNEQGEVVGAIVVFRDATQERELDRARAELISFAGHQLKAPLTYIKGNIEMLKEGKIDANTMELANEVDKSVKGMVKLIGDVLNISRIEQGEVKFKPEPTQLAEVVEDVIKESSATTKKRKIKVEFTKPAQPLLELVVDPQYIHEVFKNVISNAIKYTKNTVTISLEKKDDSILFTCTDNGIGIPQDEQSKIFSKFYVASNAAEAGIKGTGLGLSIAKVLVERMNGRIWFESEEDKGTTFYVSLPLSY